MWWRAQTSRDEHAGYHKRLAPKAGGADTERGGLAATHPIPPRANGSHTTSSALDAERVKQLHTGSPYAIPSTSTSSTSAAVPGVGISTATSSRSRSPGHGAAAAHNHPIARVHRCPLPYLSQTLRPVARTPCSYHTNPNVQPTSGRCLRQCASPTRVVRCRPDA